jgi:predicted RNA-binding protein with PUA-like domain
MRHWLMKSEPDEFSFGDLKARPRRREPWTGVRNYQVRNFFRDEFAPGDLAVFYHSSCPDPGAAGIMKIVSPAYPDPTQFDPASDYHDPKSTPQNPRWLAVDVAWEADFKHLVPLAHLRADPDLAALQILRRGNRLSVTPLSPTEFDRIRSLGTGQTAT